MTVQPNKWNIFSSMSQGKEGVVFYFWILHDLGAGSALPILMTLKINFKDTIPWVH